MTSLDTAAAGFCDEYSAGQLWLNRLARRTMRSLGFGTALIGVIGVLLGIASMMVPARAPLATATVAEGWSEIVRPLQIFGLVGTEFAKLPAAYAAQRSAEDGRRDLLTFGSLAGGTPFLQLSFHRVGAQTGPAASLAADLNRMGVAGPAGVLRVAAPTSLDTRFGPFEAADLSLVTDPRTTPCLGFRSKLRAGDVLRIAGLACGAPGKPVGRDLVGCVIDRIDLLSAGSDDALKSLFVGAERRRGPGCAPAPVVSAGAARITWLDANAAPPPLKGLSADGRAR